MPNSTNSVHGDPLPPKKRVNVAVAIVVDRANERVLIGRKMAGPLKGYWEFPGGKCEVGETPEQALHRELREEVGIKVQLLRAFEPISHDYPHIPVNLYPFVCRHLTGQAKPVEGQEIAWVLPSELRAFQFLPANVPLVERVIREWRELFT